MLFPCACAHVYINMYVIMACDYNLTMVKKILRYLTRLVSFCCQKIQLIYVNCLGIFNRYSGHTARS